MAAILLACNRIDAWVSNKHKPGELGRWGGRGEEASCDLHVSTVFQRALASTIERKIMLMSDTCSRPPICIWSHNLHACNIKGAMGEIISYHMRGITSLPFFCSYRLFVFWPFFGLPFLSPPWWFWPSIFYSPFFLSSLRENSGWFKCWKWEVTCEIS